MDEGLNSLFGGGGGDKRVVKTPPTLQQKENTFLNNYQQAYTPQGLNNAAFRESLSGYYGGQDFNAIAQALAKLNTFGGQHVLKPTTHVRTKQDDSGGMFGMLHPEFNLF
jgi:hypothetical protein